MYWDPMTMEEFAQSQMAQGLKVQLLDGVWWVEIRPCFFRPLFPFTRIAPQSRAYPLKSRLGGYLHLVPDGVTANSTMNFFVYDQLKNYSLDVVSGKQRNAIRSSMKNFTAKSITDLGEFIDSAYDIYISFQRRTNYSYKDERVNRNQFIEWARNLYRFPKMHKLGVFHDGRLSAVEISYRLDDVIVGDTLFANDESLKLKVTDFIYHRLREAAALTDAKYFFIGLPTGVESLDQSKLHRGCKVLTLQACYRINPFSLLLAKLFMKQSYQKLMQIMALPAPEPVPEPLALAGETAEGGSGMGAARWSSPAPGAISATLEPEQVAVESSLRAQEAATTDTRSIPPV